MGGSVVSRKQADHPHEHVPPVRAVYPIAFAVGSVLDCWAPSALLDEASVRAMREVLHLLLIGLRHGASA